LLLDDIAYLKAILHQVLEEQVGKKLLKVIEDLITLSLLPSRYSRTPLLSRKLSNEVKNLNLREAGQIIQAYAINFQLTNLAEENFAMQDRRAIQRQGHPVPGSIEECIKAFKEKGNGP